jgi:hypothetical protein
MIFDVRFRAIAKAALFVFILFVAHVLLSYIFIRSTALHEVKKKLISFTQRIENDLEYVSGRWDISKYNSDELTPYPNGSSGFTKPLYIVTADGYIIERTNPITGLLDTSDYKHLLLFIEPTTIQSVSNERWRVVAKPILSDGRKIGVIMVAYYLTQGSSSDISLDEKLIANAQYILDTLRISQSGQINYSRLDIRNVHYEYSFEIVDAYNRVIINNGRVPSFIDVSYVKNQIERAGGETLRDSKTNENFYIYSKVITHNSLPVGIIVSGESVQSLENTLAIFLLFSLAVACVLVFPFTLYAFKKILGIIFHISHAEQVKEIKHITQLSFDKKKSEVYVNKMKYMIPYASNQYYLCDCVFGAPKKRWETDEILKRFGELTDEVSSRKVYDAMLALNRRLGFKLVDYKDKTFMLNQDLLSVIQK